MKSSKSKRLVVWLCLIASLVFLSTQLFPDAASAQSGRKPQRPAPADKPTAPPNQKPHGTELRLPGAKDSAPPAPSTSAPATQTTPSPAAETPAAPGDEGSIKVDTTLVSIPASVLDHTGHYVPFLKVEEFHLFEDNVEQEIVEFRAVNMPFHVVLLLDTSASTRFRIEEIHHAAIQFVEQLRAEDRVMIASFDSQVYIDSEFTNDRALLREAIRRTKTGGNTKLYDAVELCITDRLNKIDGRKAIVLFTDGVDTASRATASSSLSLVEESNVIVYPVKYDTEDSNRPSGPTIGGGGPQLGGISIPGWPGAKRPQVGGNGSDYNYAGVYLQKLADASGGRLHQADTLASIDTAFARIAEELGHQYQISYYPTNSAQDGSYRRIKVRVDQPDLIVRARQGYRARGGVQAQDTKKGKRPTLQTRKSKADKNQLITQAEKTSH